MRAEHARDITSCNYAYTTRHRSLQHLVWSFFVCLLYAYNLIWAYKHTQLRDHIDVCMYTTFCSRRGEDIGNCHNYVSWLSFDPARKARGYRKRWSWQLYWVPLSLCILMTSCGGGKWSWIALLLHWTHAPCYYNGATVVPISYIVSWWSTRIYFLPQAAAALYIHLLRRRVQVGSKQ